MRRAALIALGLLVLASLVVGHIERAHEGVVTAITAVFVASLITIALITARS